MKKRYKNKFGNSQIEKLNINAISNKLNTKQFLVQKIFLI